MTWFREFFLESWSDGQSCCWFLTIRTCRSNCLLCKTMVREAKKYIAKNTTKEAIHDALY